MIINVEQGVLQGQYHKTRLSDKPFVRFLGIPYAKPPVDELRFKPPVKHPGWTGVYKAFSVKKSSPQLDLKTMEKMYGNEDCLYLNVYVPQESNGKTPVMIFVHGGVFNFGAVTSINYPPDYLIEENVILVSFNYRLNVLGFLNLDIDDCPGNMGLKDQLLAFKWVKENISAFGGDPDNITVFGVSSGAVSINYHMLSPLSKGVFQKAIMQSGCAFNPWTLNLNHKKAALELAAVLGCPSDDPHEIVQFLRRVPVNDLVKATKVESIRQDKRELLIYQFIPSIESNRVTERLIPAHPEELSKTATPIPVISGINSQEGMIIFGDSRVGKLIHINTFEDVIEFFKGDVKSDEVKKRIRSFYFDGHDFKNDIDKLDSICKIFSDVFFIKDFRKGFVHLLEKGNTPVYNYEFIFDGEINLSKKGFFTANPNFQKLKGACHADEVTYIFLSHFFAFTPKPNSRELSMSRLICKLWTNFAKTGNPNSADVQFNWDRTSLENPKYLLIDGEDSHMVQGEVQGTSVRFWQDLAELVKLNQKM